MIVVTGATGNIGHGITEKLLSEGKQVKAIGRNKQKLAALASKGAEIAEGNLEDPVFLAKAFAGAEAVFSMIPPNLTAPDFPAWQDKVGEAEARALRDSGTKYVVHLSSMGAQTDRGMGPVAGIYRQEKRLNDLPGVNVLHLRPGYFMENLFANIALIKNMGIIGSPLRPDVKIHFIATQDIAEHAARRLRNKDFTGKSVQELIGARDVSMQEVTEVLGKAIGKPDLKYVQFPYADAVQAMVGMGLSKSIADGFAELNKTMNETEDLRSKQRDTDNTTATSIEAFAPVFAAAFKA